jgi:hypothetical protein
MQNQYHPFNEIKFDFTTSLSKESAVLAMLGWIKKPFREVSEAEYEHQYRVDSDHPVSEEEELMFEPYSPCLFEILREVKDSADSEYLDAKYEDPIDEDALAEKLANIKKSHELIETAHRFYCGIDDELAKGERSELRLDQRATKNPEDPHITLVSLVDWASKKYKIELFPSPVQVTFKDLDVTQQEIIESLENKTGNIDTTNLQITFALLVEAFSEFDIAFHHDNGNPNVSTIADEIYLQIKRREHFIGLSKRNIKGYISSALNKKSGHDTQKQSITPKTLNLCLALLVAAFAGKDDRYRDANNNPNVQEIAKHLAPQATGLVKQDQEAIENRILGALVIRKNPDALTSP